MAVEIEMILVGEVFFRVGCLWGLPFLGVHATISKIRKATKIFFFINPFVRTGIIYDYQRRPPARVLREGRRWEHTNYLAPGGWKKFNNHSPAELSVTGVSGVTTRIQV